jgi:hypothetical protein
MAAWPFRSKQRVRRARQALGGMAIAMVTSNVVMVVERAVQGSVNAPAVYTCHYCQRIDGLRTRDHKVPR